MNEIRALLETESVGTVEETLDFLLYECALEDAPSKEEVALWRDILEARGGKFIRLAQLCRTWLEEEGA